MQQTQSRQITYQTRVKIDDKTEEILSLYAKEFALLERKLFVDLIKKKDLNSLKKDYIKNYQITARQFNSLKYQIEGKIQSTKVLQKEQIENLKQKIAVLEKTILKYKNPNKIHRKKRRLFFLQSKLKKLKERKVPKICFGSKKLFKSQFHLKENGFENFDQWKEKWQTLRNNSFFIIGSKDETAGCQSCQIFEDNNKLSLKIRLTNALSKECKYLVINNLEFAYGQKEILKAMQNNLHRKNLIKQKSELYKYFGQAINYRFLKDSKGFRIFVTIKHTNNNWLSKKENGLIGIDINANHLAVVETDRFLNPIRSLKVALSTYGKSKDQTFAIIGDAVAQIVNLAKEKNKPLVIEKLDFQKKKRALKEKNKKYARFLSSFSYKAIIENIKSKSFKFKIEVFEVNPVFTSVIGRIKFQKRYGLSSHMSAALTIARRYMKFSEKPPYQSYIFDKKGTMRAFFLPVRNRKKYLWSFWGEVFGILKTVDEPHFWTRNSRSTSKPKSTCETVISKNYKRNSYTLKSVRKTACLTSLKKSLLCV